MYRLGTLPPSKNSALAHFVLSRNRRANAANETGLSEMANNVSGGPRHSPDLAQCGRRRGFRESAIAVVGPVKPT